MAALLLVFFLGVRVFAIESAASPRAGTFLPPEGATAPAVAPYVPKAGDPAVLGGKGVVRWQAWGPDAFAAAARSHKPIFIFITASWCHWGKVMERVTFTDLEVATRLNEEFIPVRLDRDERPDVDLRLQQAVQALSGRRGWPLTAFLTPDGYAFMGGTYYPAEDDAAAQRPGLRGVLYQSARTWRDRQEDVAAQARELDDSLKKENEAADTAGEPAPDVRQRTVAAICAALDQKAGGLAVGVGEGGGKFPTPRALDLCLLHYASSKDPRSLEVVTKTLDGMLRGAIYDQLGGGFHRCCADRWWRVPRYEKLLVPNAEMLVALVRAWQATGEARYKRAVEDTLAFWTAMQDPSGTYFCGSQSGGTSDLDEGFYNTWTAKEIESALHEDDDCRFAWVYYGMSETGNLAAAPGRNVLYEAATPQDAALRAGLPRDEGPQRLSRVLEALRQARKAACPAPAVDRNIYVDGNALMAAAFIGCGRALGQQQHLNLGLQTLRSLLRDGIEKAGGAVHVLPREGKPAIAPRLAQDEAALLYASALAYQATKEKDFITAAEASLSRLDEFFWDKEKGGYFDRSASFPSEAKGLGWRVKVFQDTDQPSTNALVADACTRLAAATGRKEFAERAHRTIAAFGKVLEKLGPYGAALVMAKGD